MKFIDAIGTFGKWWRGQLLSLVPGAVNTALESARIRHRIDMGPDGAKPSRRASLFSGTWKQLGEFSGQQTAALARVLRPRLVGLGFRRRVLIAVPVEQLLSRSIELPLGFAANISDIARLEAKALVPGGGGTAYSGLDPDSIRTGERSVSARQLVLNGDIVDDQTTALEAEKGLDFEIAALLEDGRAVRLDPLIDESADAGSDTRWRLILAALLVVLIAANTFATITRQEEAIATLDQELVVATRKAQEVRKTLDRQAALANGVAGIQDKMQHDPRLIDVWEELTKRLPRSAWINSLAIEDRTLRITGSAKSAAELISVLDASSVLSKVRFSSPVVTNRASNDERFQIEGWIGGLP